jgi:hypothetical protein
MKNLLIFLLISTTSFAQNKKEQIEALNHSMDSLNTVLATTRDNSAKDIRELNDKIKKVRDEVITLKVDLIYIQTSKTVMKKENDKLKTDLGELSMKNLELEAKLKEIKVEGDKHEESIALGDLLKWGIRRFEGVVTFASNYDGLGTIDVKLNDGTDIIIYTSAGDGLTWDDIGHRNPPGSAEYDALGFEIGNRIKGYLGSGYFGGYGSPSGIPENDIMEGTVNRAVYIEKY